MRRIWTLLLLLSACHGVPSVDCFEGGLAVTEYAVVDAPDPVLLDGTVVVDQGTGTVTVSYWRDGREVVVRWQQLVDP